VEISKRDGYKLASLLPAWRRWRLCNASGKFSPGHSFNIAYTSPISARIFCHTVPGRAIGPAMSPVSSSIIIDKQRSFSIPPSLPHSLLTKSPDPPAPSPRPGCSKCSRGPGFSRHFSSRVAVLGGWNPVPEQRAARNVLR
jgi:hypothetical protein